MKRRLHLVAGSAGLLLISSFLIASITVELFGDHDVIVRTKTLILAAILLVIPALATTGITGRLLSRNRRAPAVRRKLRRMIAIGSLGLLVLTPCAVVLQRLAAAGSFGLAFHAVQAIELAAGAANIALMGLNFRDGLRLTGRLRKRLPATHAKEWFAQPSK
jgi:hypothetical protein